MKTILGFILLVTLNASYALDIDNTKCELLEKGYSLICGKNYDTYADLKALKTLIPNDEVYVIPAYAYNSNEKLCVFLTTNSKLNSFESGYDSGWYYGMLLQDLEITEDVLSSLAYNEGYTGEVYPLNTNDRNVIGSIEFGKDRRVVLPKLEDIFY